MVAAVKLEFLIKILPIYLNGRGQRQRSVAENVDTEDTVDTEELNPKEDREKKKSRGRFSSRIVILLTKDTQLITGTS